MKSLKNKIKVLVLLVEVLLVLVGRSYMGQLVVYMNYYFHKKL